MAKTKDSLRIVSARDPELANQITFAFQRLLDRIDKLEGIRGEMETASGTFTGEIDAESVIVADDDGNTLHSMT